MDKEREAEKEGQDVDYAPVQLVLIFSSEGECDAPSSDQ